MILCIETSSISCSVALCNEGKLLSVKESLIKNTHASIITQFIEAVLKLAGVDKSSLKAVAISKGPGSYTGLRIGVSTAKGICYALNIPLIAIPTLQAMAFTMIDKTGNIDTSATYDIFCPMIDARRMEVYYALFDNSRKEIKETSAEIIDTSTFAQYLFAKKIIFFGDGAEKCKSVISHENAVFIDNIYPSALDLAFISNEKYLKEDFENIAYFEPFYLKEFIAKKPIVKGLYD